MHDLIVIGAGPAGMTAAIYAARKNLSTLVLTKETGGQMAWSSDIENYSGFELTTGIELTKKFKDHVLSIPEKLELKEGVEVVALEKNITTFVITDKQGKLYYSKSVIIATGRKPRKLNIPGEDKFFGHGVATCATCDAPFYKNKTVAVIGGGDSAMDALLSLSKTSKKLYSINLNLELSGDLVLKSKVEALPQVTYFKQAKALEILGNKKVTGLKLQKKDGSEEALNLDGVFIEIGFEPENNFENLTQKNHLGEIKVGKNLETNVPGLFAAGDVNDAWGEQIIIASGEGSKAALAVNNYLNKIR